MNDDDDSSQVVRRGKLDPQTCMFVFYFTMVPCTSKKKEGKKKEKKKHNPWSYVKIIVRFLFHQIEYWNGNNTILEGEAELSVFYDVLKIQFERVGFDAC